MAKVCSNCGAQIQDGTKFCGKCGQKVPVETSEPKVCPNCGATLQDGVKFCGKCGQKIQVEQTTAPPQTQNYAPPPVSVAPRMNDSQSNFNRPNSSTVFDLIQEMFLSTNGRINRMTYFKRTLIVNVIMGILIAISIALFSDEWDELTSTGTALIHAVMIIVLIPKFCLDVRRIKDIGKFQFKSIPFTENNIKIAAGIYALVSAVLFFTASDFSNTNKITSTLSLTLCAFWLWMQSRSSFAGTNQFGEVPI